VTTKQDQDRPPQPVEDAPRPRTKRVRFRAGGEGWPPSRPETVEVSDPEAASHWDAAAWGPVRRGGAL